MFQLPYAHKNPINSFTKAMCKKIIDVTSIMPVMEINCVDKAEIIGLIKESGGKVINIIEDTRPEPDFKSYTYIVTK